MVLSMMNYWCLMKSLVSAAFFRSLNIVIIWELNNNNNNNNNSISAMFCVKSTGFYTKGRPLVKSNLICPSDKFSWQPGCPILNIIIQGNFCISPGNGSSDNLPENLV